MNSFDRVAFWGLLVLQVLPVWTLSYLPTQDGPGHQAVVYVMRELDGPEGSALRDYFEWAPDLVPNWISFAFMTSLSRVMSISTAERLLASAYVILLPVSMWLTLGVIDRRHRYLAIGALPFVFNRFFHKGFFSFNLSLPFFVLAFGFWWSRKSLPRWIDVVGLSLLTLITYFSHAVSAVVLMVTVCAVIAGQRIATRGAGTRAAATLDEHQVTYRALVRLGLAFLPVVILLGQFVSGRMQTTTWMPFGDRFLMLYAPLAALDQRTIVVSVLLVSVFFAIVVARLIDRKERSGLKSSAGLLWALLGVIGLVLVSPDSGSSGMFITDRLALYPFLLSLCWMAAAGLKPVLATTLKSASVVAAVAILALCWPRWIALADFTGEYVTAADYVESGRTILPLTYSERGTAPDGQSMSMGFGPFLHVSGYLASRKGVIDLGLYEANTDHFPIRYRENRNPYVFISTPADREREPPRATFMDYDARTGGRVDYVVLWQPNAVPSDHVDVVAVRTQLRRAYDEIYVSPRRLVHVYRHRVHRPSSLRRP